MVWAFCQNKVGGLWQGRRFIENLVAALTETDIQAALWMLEDIMSGRLPHLFLCSCHIISWQIIWTSLIIDCRLCQNVLRFFPFGQGWKIQHKPLLRDKSDPTSLLSRPLLVPRVWVQDTLYWAPQASGRLLSVWFSQVLPLSFSGPQNLDIEPSHIELLQPKRLPRIPQPRRPLRSSQRKPPPGRNTFPSPPLSLK